MTRPSPIHNPALLFSVGAAFLLAVDAVGLLPGTNFASAFIQQTLEAGAWFSVCAAAYFLFRRDLKRGLGEIHFWMTAAAVLVGFALPYWFTPKHGHPGQFLFSELQTNLRVALFFFAAQAVFLVNLFWALFDAISGKKRAAAGDS